MIKKIALAGALAATASFATWDKFPVLEAGKGQAKVGFKYRMPEDKWSAADLYVGARYAVIQNLELGVVLDYRLFTHYDGEDAKSDGLDNLPIMVRYQFMPTMNAFLDVTLPIGADEVVGEDGEIGFHAGVQFSQNFGMISLGTEAGLALETAGDDKTTPPWKLNIGAEADFALGGPVTPYVGLDLIMELGKYTYDGDNVGEGHTGDLGIFPYVGVGYSINQMISLDASVSLGLGNEHLVGDDMDLTIDVNAKFNF